MPHEAAMETAYDVVVETVCGAGVYGAVLVAGGVVAVHAAEACGVVVFEGVVGDEVVPACDVQDGVSWLD